MKLLKLLLLGAFLVAGGLRPSAYAAEVPYSVDFQGVEKGKLLDTLKASSELENLQSERPVESEAALQRRADTDMDRLRAVMRSEGYYEAEPTYDLQPKPGGGFEVHVRIEPGPRYTLTSVRVLPPGDGALPLPELTRPQAFGLKPGSPAEAAPVVAAEGRLVESYQDRGYPLARVVDREVIVDRGPKAMEVTYRLDTGPVANFGPLEVKGLAKVSRVVVDLRIGWTQGELYDRRRVEATRKKLVNTGLFSQVRVLNADTVSPDGRIPMVLDLIEGPPRSIGAGASYDSSTGPAVTAFFEHRNLFGEGERVRVDLEGGQLRTGVKVDFRKPDFLRLDQALLATVLVQREDVDAYTSNRGKGFLGLERRWGEYYSGSLGAQFEKAELTSRQGPTSYTLLGTPLTLRRDAADDLLNPTEGTRIGFTTTPYLGVAGDDLRFLSSRLNASIYQRLGSTDTYVLAGFAAIGSIAGEPLSRIPRDKRLYAGGGGSVRGYAYQKAGPLDAFGDPVGGRSSLETGAEARIKITETIGVVPFLEAGTVYASALPDFGERLFIGAGIGARYYSAVGPIRLDVATPLNKRPEDDIVQFYISLGQAF